MTLPITELQDKDVEYPCGIAHVNELADWFFDECFHDGIDIGWEEALLCYREELEAEGLDEDEIEDRLEYAGDEIETDTTTYLFGDWVKNDEGKYEIVHDGNKGFALGYNTDSGYVTVHWSKHGMECRPTSPCFVMRSGGPCGDLGTPDPGGSLIAYSLPADWFYQEPKEASNG